VIAPRSIGKSTWAFLVLPLWAMAHGHRSYVVAFADASGQAEGHLANLRNEIARNELLAQDFPELTPAGRNNAKDLVTEGGAAFSARGMDSRTLGAKSGADRPDLLIGDDLEPMSRYSAQVRDERLHVLLDGVLPMGDRANVLLVGTVVRYGSIMHTLAQYARGRETGEAWPVSEGIAAHYFPPILGTGARERSCWPARWPLSELRALRDAGGSKWWLNFLNDPPRPGESGAGWTPEMFTYGGADVDQWVVVVDLAPTSKATSDQTAVAVLGVDVSGRHLVVAECRGVRAQPGEIRDLVHRLAKRYHAREVHAEVNQGHDTWRRVFQPMPQLPGSGKPVRLVPFHTSSNKRERILDLVDLYGRGGVIHLDRLGELERQALAWPDVRHDDLVDVIALGAERLAGQLVRL
jgi:phage terminase large subunit-like protein